MNTEPTDVLWLDQQNELTLMELVVLSGLSEPDLHELVDYGIIAPADPNAAQWIFRADCIVVARTACRLRKDFELDAQGMALALALLDRVHDLEAQLRDLKARLPQQFR